MTLTEKLAVQVEHRLRLQQLQINNVVESPLISANNVLEIGYNRLVVKNRHFGGHFDWPIQLAKNVLDSFHFKRLKVCFQVASL